jgi:Bacterial pre-peptidase C-terminal domain
MKIVTRCLVTVVVSVLLAVGSAAGAVWTEVGDAGELIGTAQDTGTGVLTSISTDLASSTDVDLFKFQVVGRGDVTIRTTGTSDTQLFLFDANGRGIVANDNSSDLNAQITATLSTGFYYLGFSLFDVEPFADGGPIFPDQPLGLLGPTGPGGNNPLAGWEQLDQSGDALIATEWVFVATIIALGSLARPAIVPEPSAFVLMLAGVAVLAARVRSRPRA